MSQREGLGRQGGVGEREQVQEKENTKKDIKRLDGFNLKFCFFRFNSTLGGSLRTNPYFSSVSGINF